MLEGESQDNATLFPKRPGDILRDARVGQGLEVADIAARTRIPQRHLEAIEAGSYDSLPSSTYAIGFAKAYARAVGVDEVATANLVRGELAVLPGREIPAPLYEADEPSRAPSRGLVLGGVLVALAILIGIGLWYGTSLFRGGTEPTAIESAPVADEGSTVQIPITPPTPAGSGHVTLTATDEVWVRVYDSAGKTLLMKTMAPGESYDVPTDASGPMINIGRPDKLRVTVNGSQVAPLGDGRVAVKDVPIGADALLARGAPPAQASGSNTTATP
ncbi:helix-turn-helix domain-containing protein [Sphingomonas sp.]|uniref:helix-turn-helix domain-containing protein n=1 Tax=Sphingomonas sp. TaxID=28214 RepID=UPI002B6A5857|nr:RodZ domain-containing protein [Sphingomonas sp.]HWK35981.1 RodZ domain-containing protein [Sphingomonas sp.]